MAVKNRRPISISSASVAFSSPNTSYRGVNYPAFSMFKALVLPLLNGYDTVSQPLMACIPGDSRRLEPSNKHVALISITIQFQRSIWTAECSCNFQTQYTSRTKTSVSSVRIRITDFPLSAAGNHCHICLFMLEATIIATVN